MVYNLFMLLVAYPLLASFDLVAIAIGLVAIGVTCVLMLFAAGVRCLYGGEADEAIRFMEPEPVEPVPERSMSELDRALLVLKAIDGVDRVYESPKLRFDALNLNNNLVKCRVALPDGTYKTVQQKCSGDCPDKLAAARVVKEGVAALLGKPAVEAAELHVQQQLRVAEPSAAGAAAASSAPSGLPAFEFQRERTRLLGASEAARLRANRAATELVKAEREHEEQQRQHAAAKAELEALMQQHPAKRVREEAATAAAAAEAAAEQKRVEAALAAEQPPPHPRTKETPPRDNPPNWKKFWNYSRSKYQEEEVKEQDRRAVEVPKEGPADAQQHSLPPGDDLRGWHNHWRHGVFGNLQSRAQGSRHNIVYMLAKAAQYFGVVDAVRLPRSCHAPATLLPPSCHPFCALSDISCSARGRAGATRACTHRHRARARWTPTTTAPRARRRA